MNILMLGNGFDLHYYLPTKYQNFLHTVEHLANIDLISPITAGRIFSDERLTRKDHFIAECYERNKEPFDSTILDFEKICKLTKLAQNNMWFKYLLNAFNRDVGWIDFEKEIKKVLSKIKKVFEWNVNGLLRVRPSSTTHLLKYFDFFINNPQQTVYGFKDEYLIEDIIGSKSYLLDIDKIVKVLFEDLRELSEMLKIYLSEFIDKSVENISANKLNDWIEEYNPSYVISFNYTNTFEQTFSNDNVVHIHGTDDTRIVLGVNPDDDDKIESIDTSFLRFKKYYQRVILETDFEYLEAIETIEKYSKDGIDINLTIIGHSMDETDEDVIVKLFDCATYILVLYYDDLALSKHVNNLINIYGKAGFDELRYKKQLTFTKIQEEIESVINLYKIFDKEFISRFEEGDTQ